MNTSYEGVRYAVFVQPSIILSFLEKNILLSTLFSDALNLYSTISMKYQVSHSYETTDKIYKIVLHVHYSLLRPYQNICWSPRLCVTFLDRQFNHKFLAPRPTPNLENHFLLAVCDCLFNKFAATLRIWRRSPSSATRGRVMPLWQGTPLFHTVYILWLLGDSVDGAS
jgi:hypothetical protein